MNHSFVLFGAGGGFDCTAFVMYFFDTLSKVFSHYFSTFIAQDSVLSSSKKLYIMTLQEIIAAETRNSDRIYLHLEGIFWKAYERSAFAFIHRISRYKASKRFVKYLDARVVSLGFPDASRSKVLGDRPLLTETDGMLVLDGGSIDTDEYGRWKESLPLIVPKPVAAPAAAAAISPSLYEPVYAASARPMLSSLPVPDIESVPRRVTVVEPPQSAAPSRPADASVSEAVLRDLRNFSVENATPLECLIFVSSLKKQLNGNI